jgi:hypothetical protein
MHGKRRSARGAVLVEYSWLLLLIGIPALGGILKGGQAMFNEYTAAKTHILRPMP